jgi:hypothetical protein
MIRSPSKEITRQASGSKGKITRPASDIDSTVVEMDTEKEQLRERVNTLEGQLSKVRERRRKEREAEQNDKSDADREREFNESEALGERIMEPVHAMEAGIASQNVVTSLVEATEYLTTVTSNGGVTAKMVSEIAEAHDAFHRELEVAKAMTEGSES